MPAGSIPRYKVIHCKQPHKKGKNVIARIDRSKYKGWHVPADVILARIRRHYKKHHPKKFKQMARKAKHARRKK